MKLWKVFIVLLILFVLSFLAKAEVRDRRSRSVTITNISTMTAVVAGGYLPGRVWWKIINEDPVYNLRVSTWQMKGADLVGPARGWPLIRGYGTISDEINCRQTSYYVIIDSVGALSNVIPIYSTATYVERD
jgi:hypothetical protein